MTRIDIDEIIKTLPHRYPFLMVDRVLECDDQRRIVAIKNVSVNEPCFQGHFPGFPVMPGVLQLEAMAQTGGILLTRMAGQSRRVAYLLSIDKAKFRKLVRPGDQMRIEVEFLTHRRNVGRFGGKVFVDGAVASEAVLTCMFTEMEFKA